MERSFHVPVRPYGPIDALNRRAAAVGSPGYACKSSRADYNGHHVVVRWNDYKGYYTAEYTWAGRNVLARGHFADCLRAALAEHNRGALGSSVSVELREGDVAAEAHCRQEPALVPGPTPVGAPAWMTWRHRLAAESVRDYAHPGAPTMHFDWGLMQASETEEAYRSALRTKYGSERTGPMRSQAGPSQPPDMAALAAMPQQRRER